jgi:hypothetical protein
MPVVPAAATFDVLRALDCLRAAGVPVDERAEETMAAVFDSQQRST